MEDQKYDLNDITIESILNEEEHYDLQYSIVYDPTPTLTFPSISIKDIILKGNNEEEDDNLTQIIQATQALIETNIKPQQTQANYEIYDQFFKYYTSLRYPPAAKHTHVLDSLSKKDNYPFLQISYIDEILSKLNVKVQPTCIAVIVTLGQQ